MALTDGDRVRTSEPRCKQPRLAAISSLCGAPVKRMLLSLFPELRVLVLRKLCVRDLVRLSRASKQLNALCVDVGARAVQEMLAAGEDDAPLPAGLSEHVLHRLARLCGVCFVTAAFADAVIDATTDLRTDATWDLAALEKAYVVLSDRELERHEPNLARRTKW